MDGGKNADILTTKREQIVQEDPMDKQSESSDQVPKPGRTGRVNIPRKGQQSGTGGISAEMSHAHARPATPGTGGGAVNIEVVQPPTPPPPQETGSAAVLEESTRQQLEKAAFDAAKKDLKEKMSEAQTLQAPSLNPEELTRRKELRDAAISSPPSSAAASRSGPVSAPSAKATPDPPAVVKSAATTKWTDFLALFTRIVNWFRGLLGRVNWMAGPVFLLAKVKRGAATTGTPKPTSKEKTGEAEAKPKPRDERWTPFVVVLLIGIVTTLLFWKLVITSPPPQPVPAPSASAEAQWIPLTPTILNEQFRKDWKAFNESKHLSYEIKCVEGSFDAYDVKTARWDLSKGKWEYRAHAP